MKDRLIFHDVKPQILDLKTQYGRNDSSKTDQGVMWFNTVAPWKSAPRYRGVMIRSTTRELDAHI